MSLPPPAPVAPRQPPPTAPRPFVWPSLPRRAARRGLLVALVAGLLADVAARHGLGTAAGALAGAAGPVLLAAGTRMRDRRALACVAAAVALTPWLALRDSHWLLPLDVVVAGACVLTATAWGRGGPAADGMLELVRRLAATVARSATGPVWAWAHVRAARPTGVRVPRSQVLAALRALPLVALLGGLLVWGDALLASWLRLPVDAGTALAHVTVVVGGLVVFLGLHRAASTVATPPTRRVPSAARRVETTVLVIGAAVVETAFAAAQVVASAAGDGYVRSRTGLTYAEHARRGFFQLLAAAALALWFVLAARRSSIAAEGRQRRLLRAGALTVVLLSLVLVVVAVQRLRLYEAAYGLTMLRLYCTVFAGWLGVVFVLAGAACARLGSRPWLVPAVTASAVAGLLVMNALNPEAVVVRHNVAFAERTGRFDARYLVSLSDDAVPALVHATQTASPVVAGPLRQALCAPGSRHHDDGHGLAWNRADHRSMAALARLCDG